MGASSTHKANSGPLVVRVSGVLKRPLTRNRSKPTQVPVQSESRKQVKDAARKKTKRLQVPVVRALKIAKPSIGMKSEAFGCSIAKGLAATQAAVAILPNTLRIFSFQKFEQYGLLKL